MDPNRFFIVDTSADAIEFFVLHPCQSFNISNIQARDIIEDGMITSTLLIRFRPNEYEMELKDFDWVKSNKSKQNLSQLFYEYNFADDVVFKVRNYGILKSAEYSITSTVDCFTMIVREVINQKAKK
jgi:hypothetical protein